MSRGTVLILTALLMEERALRKTVLNSSDNLSFNIDFQSIGIRCAALPERVPARVSRVILSGLAGGLVPDLRVGDVILDDRDDTISAPLPEIRRGHIHSVDRAACTPSEKRALFTSTGALAVDMEGSIVRRWAMGENVRFLHLRSISDAADHAIDPAVLSLVDPMGRPKAGRVAAYLMRNPSRIRKLMTLQANSKIALARLSDAMIGLLKHLND